MNSKERTEKRKEVQIRLAGVAQSANKKSFQKRSFYFFMPCHDITSLFRMYYYPAGVDITLRRVYSSDSFPQGPGNRNELFSPSSKIATQGRA